MTVRVQLTKRHLPLILLLLGPPFAAPASAQAPTPAPAAPGAPAPIDPNASPETPAPTPESGGKDKSKKHSFQIPKLGVDFDIFMPSSGKTRSRFGKSWGGLGIGIGRPDRPSGTGRVSFDFSSQYQKSGDHHAFVAPVGISYRRAFNADDLTRDSTFIPYYGVSADLVAVDLRSVEDNVHSGLRFTAGGSALVGTTIGASGFAEAKYLAVGKVKGFDLSGLKFAIGIRF